MASSFFEDLELRRNRFWEQCTASAARHPEWTREAVEDFFLHWTAVNRQGQMKWETQPFWSTGHRMGSYMKRRRWLEAIYEAHLEKARTRRSRKELEQRRAEAAEAEAQSAYDRYFEQQERKVGGTE